MVLEQKFRDVVRLTLKGRTNRYGVSSTTTGCVGTAAVLTT